MVDGEWVRSVRFQPAASTGSDFFGLCAVLDGDRIFAGISRYDGPAPYTGMVAIFEPDDRDAPGVLDACKVAAGFQTNAEGDGPLDRRGSVSGDPFGDGVVDGEDMELFTAYRGTDDSSGGDLDGRRLLDGATSSSS